jgi:imidazolonepropionase-like amidohydrolase
MRGAPASAMISCTAGLKVAAHCMGDGAIRNAIEAGIDCIEHGSLASDATLDPMVERGMAPLQALRSATTVAADLIDAADRGRLEGGLVADVIAAPGDPLIEDVRFVMKGGRVFRHDAEAG